MVWSARVTSETNYTRTAKTLATANITCPIEGTDRIAVACLASISAFQVEEAILASIAIVAGDVRFTFALSANLVTLKSTGRQLQSTTAETLTGPAITFVEGQGIAKEAGQTRVATIAGCVVNTFKTFTRRPVAITHGVRIDVSITVARLAWPSCAETALWISEISVAAQFTSRTSITNWAFETNYSLISQFDTSATIWTRTGLTIIRRSL